MKTITKTLEELKVGDRVSVKNNDTCLVTSHKVIGIRPNTITNIQTEDEDGEVYMWAGFGESDKIEGNDYTLYTNLK